MDDLLQRVGFSTFSFNSITEEPPLPLKVTAEIQAEGNPLLITNPEEVCAEIGKLINQHPVLVYCDDYLFVEMVAANLNPVNLNTCEDF